MNLLIGSITMGLILSLLALGVFVTYRICGMLDVTTDGAFGVGAATAATLLAHGWPPGAATALGAWAGMIAGLITGIMHTRFQVNALLAGILTTTALYSGNLYIMGGGDVSVAGSRTLITATEQLFVTIVPNADRIVLGGTPVSSANVASLLLAATVVAAVASALALFFRTTLGLALRATGDNPHMARALGVSVSGMVVIGLCMANGLIGLSGALFAQYQGFANIQMGLGMILTGLASVIVGESLIGRGGMGARIAAVVGGAVIFRLIIAAVLRAGLDPNALKLVIAGFVFLALVLPATVRRHVGRRSTAHARG